MDSRATGKIRGVMEKQAMRGSLLFLMLALAAVAQPPPATPPAGGAAASAQQQAASAQSNNLDQVLKEVDDLMWHTLLGDIADVDKVEYASLPPTHAPNPKLPGATNPLEIGRAHV